MELYSLTTGLIGQSGRRGALMLTIDVKHPDIEQNTHISFAGVSFEDDKLYATGGRVLVCVGLGDSIKEARDRAYLRCGQVHFAGKKSRTDIAYQAL
jgi:phosphoribosylamine--glycine ligase